MIQSELLKKIPNLTHGFLLPGETAPGVCTVQQVHEASWLWIPKTPPEKKFKADALGTTIKGLSVGVYSADCVPLLAVALGADGAPLSVMAIHAGWRGTAQRIAERVIKNWLGVIEAPVSRLVVAIGPCIHQDAFEVGPEIPAAFPPEERAKFSRFLRREGEREKFQFDLVGANKLQLETAALQKSIALQVDVLPQCTYSQKDLPSYRRDGKGAGRILSIIGLGLC